MSTREDELAMSDTVDSSVVSRIVVDPKTKVTVIYYVDGRTEVVIPDLVRDGAKGVVNKISDRAKKVGDATKKGISFFQKILKGINSFLKGLYSVILKYPALAIATIVIILIGIAIVCFKGDFNIGGLLGKLWGKKELSNVERANLVPKGRDVPIGVPDKDGYVQHKVEKADISINPFRDKSKIKLTNGKEVQLPEGVNDKDVDTIIEVSPDVFVIEDKSREKAKDHLEKKIQDREDFLDKFKEKYGV